MVFKRTIKKNVLSDNFSCFGADDEHRKLKFQSNDFTKYSFDLIS